MLRLWMGQREPALRALDAMLQRDRHDRFAGRTRAHLLAELGRWHDAASAYRAILADEAGAAGDAATWFNLGFVLERLGAAGEAQAAFEKATALAPTLDRAWYGLGLVLRQQGRLAQAAQALARNTRLQPLSPDGWVQLALVQRDRGQREEAERIVEHLRGFEPRAASLLQAELQTVSGGGP